MSSAMEGVVSSSPPPIPFPTYTSQIARFLREQNGLRLASMLATESDIATATLRGLTGSSKYVLNPHTSSLPAPFSEIVISHIQVLVTSREAMDNDDGASWVAAYKEQVSCLTNFMNRYLINQPSWALPILYQLCRDLRELGEKADDYLFSIGAQKNPVSLEDTARHINKAFTIVATDRQYKGKQSRQKGIYYIAGLSIKCYFKVNRPTLCKNIVRAIGSSANPQPFDSYPIGHRVTWRYYMGMLAFLEEDYTKAEEHLSWAFENCHHSSHRNLQKILHLLLPLHLLRGLLPSPKLLSLFPSLSAFYSPFLLAIRTSSLALYDEALASRQLQAVEGGVWLALERAREVVLRGVFKKVWVAGGRESRVKIESFKAGLRIGSSSGGKVKDEGEGDDAAMKGGDEGGSSVEEINSEEVECLVANMIYKGYMKGYISHGHQIVVLSAKAAFPPLGRRVSSGP